MFAVAVDAVTMDTRVKAVPGGTATSPESIRASELFDQFVSAGTFKSVLFTYRHLCDVLRLKPTNIGNFYPRLKAKLHSWKAASLWAKLDKRASHKCYNRGKTCPNTRVLIIGAGPCGLRAAIEAQLLGSKVVVIEKRDRFSRNNVLHLWPFVIHDLRNLGAKKFFGKFCAGSIDHISIRQLQLILLKVALLLGVEVHENVGFTGLVEPPEDQKHERIGWRARVSPSDHPVSQYEFDVLIGADGKRNTLLGFNRKEFRGKLAIAVTANFINRHTIEEARVPEISGVAFIFNQKFFQDMREQTGIDLENIVYYKDDTHYFVMTAKKQSLLDRGVIINDYNDTARLLSAENVDRTALMEYARDAADFATNYQLPTLDFAVNHYGQADVAMFDFTSMYAAENACRIVERRGHKLLEGLVGDSLLEPFWPTGSGCARGFLSSFDVAWMVRSWASGKMTPLQVLAERESIYRLLAQTTPENLSKDSNQYTLNPSSRYPNLNIRAVLPSQVRSLYDTDGNIEDQNFDIAIDLPKKKRRRESIIHPDALLNWCKRQVALNESITIEDMTSSWKNGLALCAILHRYRPDLIDITALDPADAARNNQLAFDICERELGIPPVMTGQEMADCDVPDKLSMVSYISQIYECFRGEIPVICPPKSAAGEERAISPNRPSLSLLTKISNKLQSKRKYSIEREISKEKGENAQKRGRNSSALSKRRSRERDKGIALDLENKEVTLTNYKSTIPGSASKESINTRAKTLEEKMKKDAGLRCYLSLEPESPKKSNSNRSEPKDLNIKLIQQQLQRNGKDAGVKKATSPKVGKLRKDEWNVKMLEEKMKQQQKSMSCSRSTEKSKVMQENFDNKLRLIAKLESGGSLTPEEHARFKKFDSSLNKLNEKLAKGNLNPGAKGHNQVAAMTEHMTTIWDNKITRKVPVPPPIANLAPRPEITQMGGSEICYFCKTRVYLAERLSAEGLFFHRSCFKCEYCGSSLRLGNFSFDRDAICGGKFYCRAHFRMQKPDHRSQEMMKRKQAFLSCAVDAQEKEKIYTTILANTEKALSPHKQETVEQKVEPSVTDSPKIVEPIIPKKEEYGPPSIEMKSPNLLNEPISNILGRDQTPERVEYENSILELSEEELLTSELEEEELTQKNLGPSQDLATSDDEYSDLSTDSESDEEAFAEELERSLTADETRKLAETWQRRYSTEHSLLDSGASLSSSSEDEGSETEIGSEDGTSEDIDSDVEYSLENNEDVPDSGSNHEAENHQLKTPETRSDVMVEVPVIDLKGLKHDSEGESTSDSNVSHDLSESEECSEEETGTEVDSELESEAQALPPQIPTIVIDESPPQNIDEDQEWSEVKDFSESGKVANLAEDPVTHDITGISGSSENSHQFHDTEISASKQVTSENEELPLVVEIPPKPDELHRAESDAASSVPEVFTDSAYITDTAMDTVSLRDEHEFLTDSIVNKTTAESHNGSKHESDIKQTLPFNSKAVNAKETSYEINSAAKEIVNDILKSAQKTVSAKFANQHTTSIPLLNVISVADDPHFFISDASPCTEDLSSASESVGWAVLKSSHSSGDSEAPLIETLPHGVAEKSDLVSPDVDFLDTEYIPEAVDISEMSGSTEEHSAPKNFQDDICNPAFQEPVQTTSSVLSSNSENLDMKTQMLAQENTDEVEIHVTEKSDLIKNCVVDDLAELPPQSSKTTATEDSLNEADSTGMLGNTSCDSDIHTPHSKEVDQYNLDPSFITVRKKRHSSGSDSFQWESDNSIIVPYFGEEDSVDINFGNCVSQNSEEGVYRATLVHSVDSEEEKTDLSTHAEDTVSGVVAEGGETDQDLTLNNKNYGEVITIPKDGILTEQNTESRKLASEDIAIGDSSAVLQKTNLQQETNVPEINDVCLGKKDASSPATKTPQTENTAANAVTKTNEGYYFTPTSTRSQNLYSRQWSKPCSPNPATSSLSFSYDHSSGMEKSKTTSESMEHPSSDGKSLQSSAESSATSDSKKYRGYSGSFAEKVRPKSIFGDTIYLRSLDINLQKQQFPSLNKSTDKLDETEKTRVHEEKENDFSKGTVDPEYKVRRKLFQNDSELTSKASEINISEEAPVVISKNKKNVSYKPDHVELAAKSEVPAEKHYPSVTPQKQESVALHDSQEKPSSVNVEKPKNFGTKSHIVSFVSQEGHSDPISPYTYAQTRAAAESAFPVKVRPRSEMDVTKLRQKREKRKSVHEDIQGLLFADEEKVLSPSEPNVPSEDVFDSPDLQRKNKSSQKFHSSKETCPVSALTPDVKDVDNSKLQRTIDQEKARKEARSRARLKSDEELGLSPNNYRKKYQRQLSLSSIHYEELYCDEFFDQDDELEDVVIDGTFQAKRVEIVDPKEDYPTTSDFFTRKPSTPLSSEKSKQFITSTPFYELSAQPSIKMGVTPVSPVVPKKEPLNAVDSSLAAKETSDQFSPLNGKTELPLPHSSTTCNRTSSPETSPEILEGDIPSLNFKQKSKVKNKQVQRCESSEDEEKHKSNGKKSFFSILNFGKSSASREKLNKQRTKDSDKERSSSLPADLSAKTPPKIRQFPHLKLPKAKEKAREKQKKKVMLPEVHDTSGTKDVPSENSPSRKDPPEQSTLFFSANQPMVVPKYTVYRMSEMRLSALPSHLPVHKIENGLAPKASEDSFTDTEDDTQGSRAQANISSSDRKDKDPEEKEKKALRLVLKVQRQQELKRLRTAQEIQRRLEELEVQQKELEQTGVEVEKVLRGEGQRSQLPSSESEMMQRWYSFIRSRLKLQREEQELSIRMKDLELEDRHCRLHQEITERMAQSGSQKNNTQISEERKILSEMLRIVEERDELVAMLEQLRLREEEDDKNLVSQMPACAVVFSSPDNT